MRFLEKLDINFLSKRKLAYVISAVLLGLGLISLFVRGLELGIDFKGGSEIALKFEKPINIGDIREDLNNRGLGNVEVKTFGGESGILIRTELQKIPADIFPTVIASVENKISENFPNIQSSLTDSTSNSATFQFDSLSIAEKVSDKLFQLGIQSSPVEANSLLIRIGIADWIENILREKMPDNPFLIQKEDLVGPKIGQELKTDSIVAVIFALIVILIYLGFRFKFAFALGAVTALFHDVLITLGIFSLLHGMIPGLNLEISISVVAAFLTLVGYSINDTVVVFDRIRENLKIHKTAKLEENINKAINKTMRRTVVTSLTTLVVVTVLLFFGGDVLRGFAFTLFFGILIGTYSSVFVASSFVYEYAQRRNKKIQF